MSEIPLAVRRGVEQRQRGLCFRCVMPGADWHHRRSRRVVDEHTHCSCNGVLLCRECHNWAHNHPLQAQDDGLIVRQNVETPGEIPMRGFDGWWTLTCTAAMSPLAEGLNGPLLASASLFAAGREPSTDSGSPTER